jgi:transcriptional regulator GlxA family with amidase domain
MKKNVGILIFNDAEVLDFAGPFEVFSVTSQLNDYQIFDVFTIAKNGEAIRAVNGLLTTPNYTFDNHPHIHILIIAGGQGTRALLNDETTLNWVKSNYQQSEYTLSICSGARILGKLGLLDNRPFCTHQGVYEHMKDIAPMALPQPQKRFVQSSEKIFTSGGISAGIDLSFYVIEKLYNKEMAAATAQYMEYHSSFEKDK